MGNAKGKLPAQGEEVNVGKEIPDVATENKAANDEGACDVHAVTSDSSEHKPDSSTNGHATATGEEPIVNTAVVANVGDKAKDDTIEECPAAANDSTALADTTTDSNATTDSATKSKKKESKPLVWLKQVKKHVSFNKKKKPVVEKKCEDNAEPVEAAATEEPIAKDGGDVENNVTETEQHHHVEESPNNVEVAATAVDVPVITEDTVEDSPPPATTVTPVVEVPTSTPSVVEESLPVHDQHVSSLNENTTSASESHDAGTSLE